MAPPLKRFVALKIVRSGPNAGIRERGRWLREARAYACVRHPNIVPLHDVGEAGPWLYLVLEYISGGSLKHRLETPYAPADAARLLETIARAVAAVHSGNLVHLDLKPSNILLDVGPEESREQATPRVGDFGIAYRWSDPDLSLATQSQSGPLGTPSYMAPEQITGDRDAIGPPADIYGLGALLYHVLTGRPPFSAASVVETLEQVRSQEPVPPRRLVPQIPRDLETIALKCLAKHPAGRYASAEAVAVDLRRWLDGCPISARPVSPIEKVWRGCRRRPAIAALAALLSLAISTGLLIAILLWRRAEAEWNRTQDELAFISRLLEEISSVGSNSSGHLRVLNRDEVSSVLERARNHLIRQRMQRPNDLVILRQLADADIALARRYLSQKKLNQARTLLNENLETLDHIERLEPADLRSPRRKLDAHSLFAEIAETEGRNEESLTHLSRAVASGEESLRFISDPKLTIKVAYLRWWLAEIVRRRGDDEVARSLILANLEMLDEVPEAAASPAVTIWRTLARIDLREFKAAIPPVLTSQPQQPDPFTRLSSPATDSLDAENWADLVARCLNCALKPVVPPDRHLWNFTDYLSQRIARQRRLGRIDEARRSASRVHAFARLMVLRFPGQPVAHLAMCEAFKQMAKNAWEVDDRVAVEHNWRLAIDEARRALFLDPNDTRAGSEVADLQHRIDKLVASKSSPTNQDLTARTSSETGR